MSDTFARSSSATRAARSTSSVIVPPMSDQSYFGQPVSGLCLRLVCLVVEALERFGFWLHLVGNRVHAKRHAECHESAGNSLPPIGHKPERHSLTDQPEGKRGIRLCLPHLDNPLSSYLRGDSSLEREQHRIGNLLGCRATASAGDVSNRSQYLSPRGINEP